MSNEAGMTLQEKNTALTEQYLSLDITTTTLIVLQNILMVSLNQEKKKKGYLPNICQFLCTFFHFHSHHIYK